MFTRTKQVSLSWVRWIQSRTLNPISLRTTLILTSYLSLGLPEVFSLSIPHQNPEGISFLPQDNHLPRAIHNYWFGYPNFAWGEVQTMKLLILQENLLTEIQNTTQKFGAPAILYMCSFIVRRISSITIGPCQMPRLYHIRFFWCPYQNTQVVPTNILWLLLSNFYLLIMRDTPTTLLILCNGNQCNNPLEF